MEKSALLALFTHGERVQIEYNVYLDSASLSNTYGTLVAYDASGIALRAAVSYYYGYRNSVSAVNRRERKYIPWSVILTVTGAEDEPEERAADPEPQHANALAVDDLPF